MSPTVCHRVVVLLACGLLACGLLAAAVRGQSAQRFESAENGYRISINKQLEAVPLQPNERQILAKWGGRIKIDDKRFKNAAECTLLLVRIRKVKGPTTGTPKDDGEKSVREEITDRLNSGTTVEEFLQHRHLQHELRVVTGEKPLKNKTGEEFVCKEYCDSSLLPSIRVYTLEDSSETFGVVSLGPFGNPFDDMVQNACRSLERIAAETAKKDKDYGDGKLANVDFREQVRRKLVKGWAAYDTEHFILVSNAKNKGLIDKMLLDLELMRNEYIKRFPPIADMNVISTVRFCETYDEYLKYGAPNGTAGYWDFTSEELVLVDVQTMDKKILEREPRLKDIQVLDVMHHEAMHQYFFYSNGNLAPASWFNEGYGEVFGGALVDRGKKEITKIDRNRFRLFWIKECQRTGSWPVIDVMLKMTQAEFYNPNSCLQHYAFGWALCFFLEEQRKDPKGNKQWAAIPDDYLKNLRAITEQVRVKNQIEDKDKKWLLVFQHEIQQKAFEATFKDVDLDKLEKAWIEAMKRWK